MTADQRPPTRYSPPPAEAGERLGFLFGLLGMVVGPAVAVGADYLFWLCQPPAGGEGGYAELVHFELSLYCCGFFGLVAGILGGWGAGTAIGRRVGRRVRRPP